jgi:ABC-2 type transport system permease protein
MPSLLLSGFLFPFRGMPEWAQIMGNIFPMTHALRIIRGVVLKGINGSDIWVDTWPMLVFMVFIGFIAMKRYRETID